MAKGPSTRDTLYGSSSQVRDAFKEFRKGTPIRDGRVGIIHAYKGLARRVHYSDALDTASMTLSYIGKGRTDDQKLTRGNHALVEAGGIVMVGGTAVTHFEQRGGSAFGSTTSLLLCDV